MAETTTDKVLMIDYFINSGILERDARSWGTKAGGLEC